MGRCGMQRTNVWFLVLLSVLLLMGVAQASFDMSSETFVPQRTASLSNQLDSEVTRRMLAASGYYVGYGALTANRVPCPPQSGRSYYTPGCSTASGPVRPYTRGCSTITRCARDG
ncbi:protein MpRALF1 [Marchantia polymorpha subsp. ruderalis]|nr:hypothetical protein MARPO_0076s0067 [Marchantia polymorpha]BBN16545.1 hypothetical protein Mp_7g07270 [Marchantia polymorpha subsp. ruderalis]|eukprot:PTQ34833.1 hypothetical protein MARPO_0076s0067 [Marchantia polymorpha]